VAKFRVSSPPVADKDTVVVLTDSGKLAAYRATPAAQAPAAPASRTAAPAAAPSQPEAPTTQGAAPPQ
jgi:hypothetical protein